MNLDRNAFALLNGGTASNPGDFLVQFFDTQASDYKSYSDSYFYLGNTSRTEVSALNLVHDITPVGSSNPTGQAANRHVKSTTPNFSIDSETLAGTGLLGMTGIELFRGLYSGSLITGDYSLLYNPNNRQNAWADLGQDGTPSGWYLQNNVSFSMVVYELTNLVVSYTDANHWQMSGDLLMSPENADFLHGARLADMGDFCLGVGSHSGCGQVSTVPVPAALWLFISGLTGMFIGRLPGRRS
ncbi:hypothetical protein [Methylomonas sp. DH-1]|nr:hypothetical protein AYM39_00330 [Methylomonas sp. DH-1]